METTSPSEMYREIGQRLRRARLRLNLSQEELAREINTTAVSISRWERGIVLPQPLYRAQLCRVFGLDGSALFGESNENQQSQFAQPSFWYVPYLRNPLFTGRLEILQRLCELLHTERTRPQAICGMGGVGKTQLALEYVYRYQQEYQAIFWLRSETRETLSADFVLLAEHLNLPAHTDPDQQRIIEAVKGWLSEHTNWLCIFDNVEDLALLNAFIPSRRSGHILLTTRAQATGVLARRVELMPMEQDEGALLLLRRAKLAESQTTLPELQEEERALALAITRLLDGLPLALDQVGAYIEETGCTLADYLRYFQERRATLLNQRGRESENHPQSVTATFALSYEKVEQARSRAADLLKLCAFLHPDAIPEELCTDLCAASDSAEASSASDLFELETALATLRMYSLVKRNAETRTLTIHRLVQTVLRDNMEPQLQYHWGERAIMLLSQRLPEPGGQKFWPIYQRYLPHVEACAALLKEWKLVSPDAGRILSLVGAYLVERAQYNSAKTFLLQALTLYQRLGTQGQQGKAVVYRSLSELYFYKGEYLRALPCAQKALTIFRRISNGEHAEMATCLNNLAALYHARGDYVQAEKFYREGLEMRQRILGSIHPDIAESLNNLAFLYQIQEKFSQAEPLYQQALTIYEKTLGPGDALVARGLNNLAKLYSCMGEPERAEAAYLRSLALYEQTLDSQHPLLAFVLHNLAVFYYQERRDLEQIEALFLRALRIREQVLGENHPDLASTLYWLALHYRDQGRYVQARPLLERALAIREQALGPQHQRTAECLHHLAVLYVNLGEIELAVLFYRRALTIRESVLGKAHPEVSSTLQNLVELLARTGRSTEARALSERLVNET